MNNTFFIVIGIAIVLVIIFIYNSLISKKNQVKNALSGIDVQLKKRSDLVPNLINTVKGYMEHEKQLLEAVTKTRTQAAQQKEGTQKRFASENMLTQLLAQLYVVAENYPQLKASENFLKLQAQLYDIEEHIAAARRAYNGAVYTYNNIVQMFPSSLVASAMGFKSQPMFDAPENETTNVNVNEKF
ncbi:MAG TPA: LemA family protein [Patescibacteria group bacterium]|nr:LemA family protein [Patescibacteria group bacterium]